MHHWLKEEKGQNLASYLADCKVSAQSTVPITEIPSTNGSSDSSTAGGSFTGSRFYANTTSGLYPDSTDKNVLHTCVNGQSFVQHCMACLVFDTPYSCYDWWEASPSATSLTASSEVVVKKGLSSPVQWLLLPYQRNWDGMNPNFLTVTTAPPAHEPHCLPCAHAQLFPGHWASERDSR